MLYKSSKCKITLVCLFSVHSLKFIMSWTNMFNEPMFQEKLAPSLVNVNDLVAHIHKTHDMDQVMKTIFKTLSVRKLFSLCIYNPRM